MPPDLPNFEPAAISDIGESLPPTVAAENPHAPQSAETVRQSIEPPVATGSADVIPTPSGPTAEDVDPSAAASFRETFAEVADFIKSCTAPPRFSTKWSFLDGDDFRLRIEMETLEFLEALSEEFGAEVLTELGLYKRVVHALDGGAPLYVTIDAHNFTISFGCDSEFLFPIARTALDYGLERNPPETTQSPVTLFVVDSQDAVDIIQRLRLPAVSSEGLESLGRDDIQRLFEGDLRSDLGWRYYLLLLDFELERLINRPTATSGEVIRRLADAADVYGVDPTRRFGVCRPSAHEFQKLERAITFKDSAPICQLFEVWSAATKSAKINSWRTHFDTQAANFSVARAALVRALQRSNDAARRAEVLVALPAYRAACRRAVIQKFVEDIDSASDPFDQVDLIAAVGYAEAFFDSDPLVRASEAVLAGQNPPSARELQCELFEQWQRCILELRRIRRERTAKR